jgi:hypothetical protein
MNTYWRTGLLQLSSAIGLPHNSYDWCCQHYPTIIMYIGLSLLLSQLVQPNREKTSQPPTRLSRPSEIIWMELAEKYR